jgi:hypothetical protein
MECLQQAHTARTSATLNEVAGKTTSGNICAVGSSTCRVQQFASSPTNVCRNRACPAKDRGIMIHDLYAYSVMEIGDGSGKALWSEDEKFCCVSCWREYNKRSIS